MYFHTDCGHIIEEDYSSPFISENGWNHYTHMYLSRCPQCDDLYPYVKIFDESVRGSVQEIVYRLLNTNHRIHVPCTKSEVGSIRVKNVDKNNLGVEINHEAVGNVDQYDKDVLIQVQ